MKEITKEIIRTICISFVVSLILFDVFHFLIAPNNNLDNFKLSSLPNNTGLQICTSSVNSKALVCNKPNIALEINDNTTLASLDNFIKSCPDAILTNSQTCTGNLISYENGGFTYLK